MIEVDTQSKEKSETASVSEPDIELNAFQKLLGTAASIEQTKQRAKVNAERSVAHYLQVNDLENFHATPYVYQNLEHAKSAAVDFWAETATHEQLISKGIRYFSRAIAVRQITNNLEQRFPQEKKCRASAEAWLHYLEESGSPLLYKRESNRDKGVYFSKINYSDVAKENVILPARLNKSPEDAFRVLDTLVGNEWQTLLSSNLHSVTNLLETVRSAKAQHSDFQERVDLLSGQLRSLHSISCATFGETTRQQREKKSSISYTQPHKDLVFVIEALANGGLTETQLHQLQTVDRLAQMFPGRYENISITSAFDEYPKAALELAVAEAILSDRSVSGDQENLKPYQLQAMTQQLLAQDGASQVLLRIREQYGIKINPEELVQVAHSSQQVEGEKNEQNWLSHITEAAQSGELEYARAIAEMNRQELQSGNIEYYLLLAKVFRNIYVSIASMSGEDKLFFYRSLVNRTSFWALVAQYGKIDLHEDKFKEQSANLKSMISSMVFSLVFTENGKNDLPMLISACAEGIFNNDTVLSHISPELHPFFRYLLSCPLEIRRYFKSATHDQLISFIDEQNKETHSLIEYLYENSHPQQFIAILTKDRLGLLVGTEQAERFLASLPKSSDERRNALTHNDYDRTSQFLDLFASQLGNEFNLRNDISILTEFVEVFGLSRSPEVFHLFKLAKQFELGKINEKPVELEENNISSSAQVIEQVTKLSLFASGEQPFTSVQLESLSAFQVRLLEIAVGKTTHRFDSGRPSFAQIISDYIFAEKAGEIAEVATEYQPSEFRIPNVELSIESKKIEKEYGLLRTEIVDGLEKQNAYEDLLVELAGSLEESIASAKSVMENMEATKLVFVQKNIEKMEMKLEEVKASSSLDELLVTVLNLSLGKGQQGKENSIKRRILFRKLFQIHSSPGFIQELHRRLSEEVSPVGVLSVINVIDEMVSQHLLNFRRERQGAKEYWSESTLQQLTTTKPGKELFEIFRIADLIRETAKELKVKEQESSTFVKAIPSRDFIAEVSGYLADACYTKEYPLLPGRQVVPVKFVTQSEISSNNELPGSVLLFEVATESGENCLLVRAFNYKDEQNIDIGRLIEDYLDSLVPLGRSLGKKYILVSGVEGAISNYPLTENHFLKNYVTGKDDKRVSLSEPFTFNDYDLTNDCYIAREVR